MSRWRQQRQRRQMAHCVAHPPLPSGATACGMLFVWFRAPAEPASEALEPDSSRPSACWRLRKEERAVADAQTAAA